MSLGETRCSRRRFIPALITGTAATLVGSDFGEKSTPERVVGIGKIPPLYSIDKNRLSPVNAYAVDPLDTTTIPALATGLLTLAPIAAQSLDRLTKHEGRRALVAGAAVSLAGSFAVSHFPEATQELVSRVLGLLPGDIHDRGARATSDPIGTLLHFLTDAERSTIREHRSQPLTIGSGSLEDIGDGYTIARFTVNNTSAPFGLSQLFGTPQIAVGIAPVGQEEQLRFPTELNPHPSGTTIAADVKEFNELLGNGKLAIAAGAASRAGTVSARRVTADISQVQLQDLDRLYVSPSVPYAWDNAVTESPTPERPLTTFEQNYLQTVQAESPLSEFRQPNMALINSINNPCGPVQYQTQFIVNPDYTITGSDKFQVEVDNTINLVARTLDRAGNKRSLIISGQWWWELTPKESANLLKQIMQKLDMQLVQAYSVDTGSQTGFYYKDRLGKMQFVHKGQMDDTQHTAVAAVLV